MTAALADTLSQAPGHLEGQRKLSFQVLPFRSIGDEDNKYEEALKRVEDIRRTPVDGIFLF